MKKTIDMPRDKFSINAQWLSPLIISASILILGFLAYLNTFHADFHFDDHSNILNAKSVQEYLNLPLLWHEEKTRFIAYLTFAFNYRIGDLDPFSYHVVNWFVHILSVTGVFFLLKMIFLQKLPESSDLNKTQAVWMAWAGALFFLLHPIQTQAVTYVVQRTAALAALFYILAVLFYGLARKGNPEAWRWYALSAVSTLLALFTKQNTFSLPGALLAYELCFVPKTERSSQKLKQSLPILGALFSLPLLVYLAVYFRATAHAGLLAVTADSEATMTRWQYFLTQQSVIAHYLRLVILPMGQNVDYDWPIAKSFFELRTMLGVFVLLTLLTAGIICFKKGARAAAFGIFLFFIAMTIESSIIPIADVIYEHRMYLPMAGLSIVFAVLLKNFAEWFGNAMLLLLLMASILGTMTYQRNKVWATEASLWEDVIKKSPRNARAYESLGVEKSNRNDLDGALPLYTKALALAPDSESALMNRGCLYQLKKMWGASLKDFLRSLEINNDNFKAAFYAGFSYLQMGNYEAAEKYFKQTIQKKPDYHGGYYRLGDLYKRTNRLDEAIPLLVRTIDLVSAEQKKTGRTDHLEALMDAGMWLAGIYYGKQNYDLAIQFFNVATAADPNWGLAYYGKAMSYGHLGNGEKVMDQIDVLKKLREQKLLDNLRKAIKLHKGTEPGETPSIEVDEAAVNQP